MQQDHQDHQEQSIDCEKKAALEKLAVEEFVKALEDLSEEALKEYIKNDYLRKIVKDSFEARINELKIDVIAKIEKQCPKSERPNNGPFGPSCLYDYFFNWPL